MGFVLDASVTLSWCFADESSAKTNAILEKLATETAIVPSLWHLEIGNILIGAERKHRITYAKLSEFLALLSQLNIKVDHEASTHGFHDILSLAHAEKITTYDAAYLELAMRQGLPLASKDKLLRKVATQLGVKLLPV